MKRTAEEKYLKEIEDIDAAVEAVVRLWSEILKALNPFIKNLMETLLNISKKAAYLKGYSDAYWREVWKSAENYPNKRVVHLAKHAKKERVRKKNINRIIEWYARGRR